MNKGFYIKNEDGSIQKANSIATPEGIFDELNKDESPSKYKWFDTSEEAYTYFAEQGKEQTPLEQWWDNLETEQRVLIYEYAPNAILAWQRDELTEMVSLIMKNQEPLLSDLKEQVQAFL